MRPTNSGRAAFSLVELMLAVAVFTIALLGLMSALTSSQQLDSMTRERSEITMQALTRMDDVLAETWDTIDARNAEAFDVTLATDAGAVTLTPGGGRAQSGLVEVTTPATDLRLVHVSVRWKTSANGTGTVDLYSMIGRH